MSYDRKQFETLIRKVLDGIDPDLCSDNAVLLLLGTAAQESKFGTYLRQKGSGPAIGAFQMEPFTFNDLQTRFMNNPDWTWIRGRRAEEMEWDLRLAIGMARLKYYSIPDPIPVSLEGQAAYWLEFYNGGGKGTLEAYIANFNQYVGT